jgi:uncharacterized protein YeaO (DUF488 family)
MYLTNVQRLMLRQQEAIEARSAVRSNERILVFSARDAEHNNAVALKKYLESL